MYRALVFAVAVMCLGSGSLVADDLHVVDADFAFAASSQQDLPLNARLGDQAQKQAPLYFWTKIEGDGSALDRIAAAKVLPIRHVWTVRCYKAVDSANDDVQFESEENIFVGQTKTVDTQKWDKLIADLKSEINLNTQGNKPPTFDWRTESWKANLRGCVYSVSVEDSDGRILWCDNIRSLCSFKIRLSQ